MLIEDVFEDLKPIFFSNRLRSNGIASTAAVVP
jgi:hypothetical protein